MTLYVESNFVLEIALGQEELVPAERLLAAAEAGAIDLALPSFSLTESFVRISRGIRDRQRLMRQFNTQVDQIARSTPHQAEVGALQSVPNVIATIDQRESDRLASTIERILATAKLIELESAAFQAAMGYRTRYALDLEDAVILAVVVADLTRWPGVGQHLFANRNRKDFDDPGIAADLKRLGCDVVWSFTEAATRLGIR